MRVNKAANQAKSFFMNLGHFSMTLMVLGLVVAYVKPEMQEVAQMLLFLTTVGGFFGMILFYSGGFFFTQVNKKPMGVRQMIDSPHFAAMVSLK